MANKPVLSGIDLSTISDAELSSIQNSVLRQIMTNRLASPGVASAGHDSHGSVHSKNFVLQDVNQVTFPEVQGGPQLEGGPQVSGGATGGG